MNIRLIYDKSLEQEFKTVAEILTKVRYWSRQVGGKAAWEQRDYWEKKADAWIEDHVKEIKDK